MPTEEAERLVGEPNGKWQDARLALRGPGVAAARKDAGGRGKRSCRGGRRSSRLFLFVPLEPAHFSPLVHHAEASVSQVIQSETVAGAPEPSDAERVAQRQRALMRIRFDFDAFLKTLIERPQWICLFSERPCARRRARCSTGHPRASDDKDGAGRQTDHLRGRRRRRGLPVALFHPADPGAGQWHWAGCRVGRRVALGRSGGETGRGRTDGSKDLFCLAHAQADCAGRPRAEANVVQAFDVGSFEPRAHVHPEDAARGKQERGMVRRPVDLTKN